MTIGGKSSGRILVEEAETAVVKSIQYCLPTIQGSLVKGDGIPGRIMGIKISKDKGIILKVKEAGKIRSITWRAGGVGREGEVNDIKGRPIVFHSETINLHSSIKRVKEVKGGVLYISGDKEGYTLF